ncbi:MAG: PIN domain-containing protein [Isosphaeraceae bacterium]
MTASTALVGTNILIYAADPAAGDKRDVALGLIEQLTLRGELVVSAQVLNEFYHAATRTNKPPALSHEEASQTIQDLANAALVLPLTVSVTLRALDAITRTSLSFWDALIWAAARENSVPLVYTEDFQHGRDIDGVRFVNPFVFP